MKKQRNISTINLDDLILINLWIERGKFMEDTAAYSDKFRTTPQKIQKKSNNINIFKHLQEMNSESSKTSKSSQIQKLDDV